MLQKDNKKYIDKEFPPEPRSIIGSSTSSKFYEWGKLIWLRPEEFWDGNTYEVF